MNILEFIETQYPIKDKIRLKLEDPYKRIEGSDNLPYDVIGPDENGVITKLIEGKKVQYNNLFASLILILFSFTNVDNNIDPKGYPPIIAEITQHNP